MLILSGQLQSSLGDSLQSLTTPGDTLCRHFVPVAYSDKFLLGDGAGEGQRTILVEAMDIQNLQTNQGVHLKRPPIHRNRTKCGPEDPLPLPVQPAKVEDLTRGGCAWKWQCYKDATRMPPTWLEAVLACDSRACGDDVKRGECQVDFMPGLVLRKSKCKTEGGERVWRASLEPYAVSASCRYKADDQTKHVHLPSSLL